MLRLVVLGAHLALRLVLPRCAVYVAEPNLLQIDCTARLNYVRYAPNCHWLGVCQAYACIRTPLEQRLLSISRMCKLYVGYSAGTPKVAAAPLLCSGVCFAQDTAALLRVVSCPARLALLLPHCKWWPATGQVARVATAGIPTQFRCDALQQCDLLAPK